MLQQRRELPLREDRTCPRGAVLTLLAILAPCDMPPDKLQDKLTKFECQIQ